MSSPTLKQLNYLCALAELKHFGNAARSCYVSQSTLSAGISDLEQSLGVTLVERSNKAVFITPLGEEIVKRSRHILMETEDLIALCQASRNPFYSKIRMGIIPTIAPFILPKLLKELRRVYPEFELHIREDLSGRLVEALKHGELDLLLLALPFPAEGVEKKHLFYDDLVLAYSKNHPIRKVRALRSQELKGQKLLLLDDGHCLRDHVLEACKLNDKDLSTPYRATSLNTIVQMVNNNIGITLLPRLAVDAKILTGTNVETRQFEQKNIWRSIGLMWRGRSRRKQEYEMLGEFIREYIHPEHNKKTR